MLFYEVFLNIRDVMLEASIFALIVMALRLIFKRAPKWVNCFMWALVAIRLVIPFYFFEIPVDYVPDTPLVIEQTLSVTEPSAEVIEPDNRYDNVISAPVLPDITEQEMFESVTPEVEDGRAEVNTEKKYDYYDRIAYAIWLSGVCVMLLYALVSYIRLKRKVRTATPLKANQWICDEIKTPFILGFINPRIYLPSSLQDETLRHVISHEKAHLKRKDYLWKPFGFILLSLNWFNPILWLSYILLCRDIELACDEKVIKEMDTADKKAYSEALLRCSVPQNLVTACPVAFGEIGVKQRIKSVLNYKKPAFWIVIVAVIVSIVVFAWFMSETKEKEGKVPDENTLPNIEVTWTETDRIYTKTENGGFLSPSGEEYTYLSNEMELCYFGETEIDGYVEGEEKSSNHLGVPYQTGLFSFKSDETKNVLIRRLPDNEFYAIYRKASLPEVDFSLDNGSRFELVRESGLPEKAEAHLICGKGITDKSLIAELLSDVRSQLTAEEAGFYEMVTDQSSGMLTNCYVYGYIYVFYDAEPRIGRMLEVSSFNDLAYSVEIDGVKYVLPEKWCQIFGISADESSYSENNMASQLWFDPDVWKYNPSFSTYGYQELHLYVDEKYEITDFNASVGTVSEIAFEKNNAKLNGIKWKPENGEADKVSITISTLCKNKEVDFNITLTKLGADGPTTFYQLSAEDKNFSRIDAHYRYIFDEEEIDISDYTTEPVLLADKIPNAPDWQTNGIASAGLEGAFAESVTEFSSGKVYLLSVFLPSENYRHQYLAVETESHIFFKDVDVSYGSQIYLCDVDGTAGEEIILNQMVGVAGGGGAYNSSVYRITENGLQLIYYSSAVENSSGFESKLEAPFTVRITNKNTGYELLLDFKGTAEYAGTVFDEEGYPIDSSVSATMFDSFLGFSPVDINGDGIYEIECVQYTSLYSHVDFIGLARSVLKYNENTGEFDVVVAEFIPEALEDVPESYWNFNPSASAELHYVTQFVLPDGYEIKSAEASDGNATVDSLYNRPDGSECVKWSPGFYEDGTATKETDLTIKATKDGKNVEFRVKITDDYENNNESDIALKTYKITPVNCKMREVTAATYYLEEK